MVVVVVVWYASLYLGWFLVFFSVQGNVLASPTLTEASGLEKLYFTGVTLSGLGYGDFTPSSFPWTMGSTLAVFTATLLTSLGLSYIIGVVPVALEKRQMAQQINAVIDNWTAEPGQFTTPEDAQFVWQHLFSIQLNGAKFSTKYGAYPVVAYFHASDKHAAFPVAYLKAADLLFYLANHPDDRLRPSQAEIKSLKHLMNMHLDNLDPVLDISGDNPELAASRFNVPAALTSMDGDTFCWRDYAPLRRRIVAACVYDGW
ncbi:hypothetical protein [Gilvimarinus sp. DA14]|uniref:hypothetical protein n=1 Tax=Gilvimarinus sp. DA14 TaxID=2956798 RepID=UPI0020B68493|nr:hypothetical protein [Gilvimarinus sp. DA14]UTF60206.1 hypothetical protein NHM04_17295 [Gilvimarinus sp. DA14]